MSGLQPTETKEVVADQARHWIIEFDAGDISPADHARFMRWLNASSLHRQAYEDLRNQWRRYDVVQRLRTDVVDPDVVGKSLRRRNWRRLAAPLAAAAALAVIVSGLLLTQTPQVYEAEYGTVVGQQRAITLPDESLVTLNTNTRVKIRYTRDERRVELLRGEAHFEVAKAADRPFVVVAEAGIVRAVGTAFAVHLSDGAVEVTVTEGTVAVLPPDTMIGERPSVPPPGEDIVPGRLLTEGHKLRYKKDFLEAVDTVTADEIDRELAWRDGMLDFERTPLSIVIAEAGRYTRYELIIVDAELEALEFTGYFRAGDLRLLLRLLESNEFIEARRVGSDTVHITKAGTLPR